MTDEDKLTKARELVESKKERYENNLKSLVEEDKKVKPWIFGLSIIGPLYLSAKYFLGADIDLCRNSGDQLALMNPALILSYYASKLGVYMGNKQVKAELDTAEENLEKLTVENK
jgi:hypothetical protein